MATNTKTKTVRFHYPKFTTDAVAPTDLQHLATTVFKGYTIITPSPAFNTLDKESHLQYKLQASLDQIVTLKAKGYTSLTTLAPHYKQVDIYTAMLSKQWKQASKNTKSIGVDVHSVIVKDISEIDPDHNIGKDFTMNTLNMLINNTNVKSLYLVDSLSGKATRVPTIKVKTETPDWETINTVRKEAIISLQMAADYVPYDEETFTSFNSVYYDTPSTDVQYIKTTDKPYYLKDDEGNIIKDSKGNARLLGYYNNTRISYRKVMTSLDYLSFQYYLKHDLIQEQEFMADYEPTDPRKLTNLSTSHSLYTVYKERKLFSLDQSPEIEYTYTETDQDEVEILIEETETDSEFTPYEDIMQYSRKETRALDIADKLAEVFNLTLDQIAEDPSLIKKIKELLNK